MSPPCQQIIWKACRKKGLSCHFIRNISTWSSLYATGTFQEPFTVRWNKNWAFRQPRWVRCKKKNVYTDNKLHVSMGEVEFLWAVFLPKHHDLHEIPGHFQSESGCPCQETKTRSSLNLPARQWSKTFGHTVRPKLLTEHKIKLLPWPSQSSYSGLKNDWHPWQKMNKQYSKKFETIYL